MKPGLRGAARVFFPGFTFEPGAKDTSMPIDPYFYAVLIGVVGVGVILFW